jgi:hypothetical protein
MMNDQPYSPDELFRQFQRGALDYHTLISQILLNMIDLSETQQAHSVLLEAMSAALSDLGEDIAAIYDLLRMRRPSQADSDENHDGGNRSNEGSADDPAEGGEA